ncbi:hypothetical protein CTEN210_06371 [Chaetoceros tenuissimus]|uniref:Uncharacterized protein n=1 Tax=Chaetoceros tenuissimus TaxID=426638 RepID=A0AAD3H4C0_9STRA|nr:hypothetical protein CTEN210_06371 [Chaetoceros tenuissimus]
MDISTFQSNLDFIKSLYSNKEWKDEDCKNDILEAVEECNEMLMNAFGKSLQRLWDHKSSAEAVEKVVRKFPSTLSYVDEDYREIPIVHAAGYEGFEYIPVLAQEGIKHKVGGEDARGGLLTIDSGRRNTLQILGYYGNDHAMKVNVFQELRELGLLQKNDIQEYKLLEWTCVSRSRDRFEYLVSWDPDALIETRVYNQPLIHYMVDEDEQHSSMHLLLKAGFEYHPKIGGILFVEDDEGMTGLDYMCEQKGVDAVISLLQQILSPSCDFPILHHVFIKEPKHIKLFTEKFP